MGRGARIPLFLVAIALGGPTAFAVDPGEGTSNHTAVGISLTEVEHTQKISTESRIYDQGLGSLGLRFSVIDPSSRFHTTLFDASMVGPLMGEELRLQPAYHAPIFDEHLNVLLRGSFHFALNSAYFFSYHRGGGTLEMDTSVGPEFCLHRSNTRVNFCVFLTTLGYAHPLTLSARSDEGIENIYPSAPGFGEIIAGWGAAVGATLDIPRINKVFRGVHATAEARRLFASVRGGNADKLGAGENPKEELVAGVHLYLAGDWIDLFSEVSYQREKNLRPTVFKFGTNVGGFGASDDREVIFAKSGINLNLDFGRTMEPVEKAISADSAE